MTKIIMAFLAFAVATATLALAVAALAWQLHSQSLAIAEQARSIQELNLKFVERPQSTTLEQQDKCSQQSTTVFNAWGSQKEDHPGSVNHYNDRLNKCFIVMQTLDTRSTPGSVFISKTLLDAFEGKTYGEFFLQRQARTGNQEWLQCYVTQTSGEEQPCKSQGEFDTLTDAYMK
jgi:hypothetical protein